MTFLTLSQAWDPSWKLLSSPVSSIPWISPSPSSSRAPTSPRQASPGQPPGFTVESQPLHSLLSSGARVQILFLVFNPYFFTGSFYLLCNKSSPSLNITRQFYPISCRLFTHKLIWKVAMVTLFTCTPSTPWATTSWLLAPISTLSPIAHERVNNTFITRFI